MRSYLGLFFIAALFSLLVTPAVRSLGRWLEAYGQADDGRELRVPRLGGLAIFLAAFAAWGVLLLLPNDVRARFLSEWRTLAVLMGPGTLVLLLGLYDDLAGATPWQKLMIELLAAGTVWWAGLRIDQLPLIGSGIHSHFLSFLLTVFWIVAMTNSFNLIDGLDGLAAGIAFFVTLSVFVVSLIQGSHFVCILAITLAGALLGFLRFNFSPATIFLGDTGSLFLGFVLATLAVHTSQKSSTLLAIVVPFVAFGLPALDTLLTVVRRFLSGRPLFVGDHDHIHHRLLRRLSPRAAALVLYAMAALFSLGSLLIIHSTGNLVALVATLAGVSGWFLTSRVHYEELSELKVHVSRALHSQRRVLANQILIRKVSGQLKEPLDLERSWHVLVKALEALDFDTVACQLSVWQNGSTPFLAPWSRPGESENGDCWTVSIPLRAGGKALGQLQLRRTLGKEHLIFHFSSLLDTLIPAFEKQVKRRYDSEEATLVIGYTVEKDLAFHPNLLANGRKG